MNDTKSYRAGSGAGIGCKEWTDLLSARDLNLYQTLNRKAIGLVNAASTCRPTRQIFDKAIYSV